jgi:pumilio RNA-binding family
MYHIITQVYKKFLIISLSQHGTRVVQKIIECIERSNETSEFFQIFNENLMDLIMDVNGSHIVNKYLSTNLPKECIYTRINQKFIEIATNKYGCCVLQKAIDLADSTNSDELLLKSLKNALILICDEYGNYVLKYILTMKNGSFNSAFVNLFKDSITYLAKQKYPSNVIEKVLWSY